MSFTYQWLRCDAGGANCAEIGGATASTYTLQAGDVGDTIRVRVSDGVSTVTSDTIGPISATAPGGSAFDDVVPTLTPPAMTVSRHIVCTTRSQFNTALANLQAGDWVDCQGITFTGQVTFSNQLSAYAKFTFDAACSFTGSGGTDSNAAIWMPKPAYLQLLFNGCEITNPTGLQGIRMHGGSHIVIDGFLIHDCGGTGLDCLAHAADGGDIHDCFFRGEVYSIGLRPSTDSHIEKGTGIHCMHAGDGQTATFHHNTTAIYGHDCGPDAGGSVVECGDQQSPPHDNVFYVKAANMSMVATIQIAGNAVILWGIKYAGGADNNDFKIIEATNMQGRALDQNGVNGGVTWAGTQVEYGRADNCCQNPNLGSTETGISSSEAWDPRHSIVYGDIATV
jgi:hypothetical protein